MISPPNPVKSEAAPILMCLDEAPPWLTVEKALVELDVAVAKVGTDAPALAGYREHLEGLRS